MSVIMVTLRLFWHREQNLGELFLVKTRCGCLHGRCEECLAACWSGGPLGFAYKYREIFSVGGRRTDGG